MRAQVFTTLLGPLKDVLDKSTLRRTLPSLPLFNAMPVSEPRRTYCVRDICNRVSLTIWDLLRRFPPLHAHATT